jgi:hypothetical protein
VNGERGMYYVVIDASPYQPYVEYLCERVEFIKHEDKLAVKLINIINTTPTFRDLIMDRLVDNMNIQRRVTPALEEMVAGRAPILAVTFDYPYLDIRAVEIPYEKIIAISEIKGGIAVSTAEEPTPPAVKSLLPRDLLVGSEQTINMLEETIAPTVQRPIREEERRPRRRSPRQQQQRK